MLLSDYGEMPTPIFVTSWTLTFFAHDVENFECVQRLYDSILASHPLMIVYIMCACILAHRDEIVENYADFQSSVSFFIFKAPLTKMNSLEMVERIIERA